KVNELKIKQELEIHFVKYLNEKEKTKKTISESIDHPVYFDFGELISSSINLAIEDSDGSSQKIREHLSTLKMRLHSYLSDERLSNPLLLAHKQDIVNGLAKYLAFILGDFCKIYQAGDDDVFTNYYKKQLAKSNVEQLKDKTVSQVTIVDMSLLPFEVLETVTGLIGRLVLEFVSRFSDKDRASLPIVLALEEAQNYIP